MWATCYCDGSYDPSSNRAAYALWLRSEDGRYIKNNLCPEGISESYSAELFSCYAAVWHAVDVWGSDLKAVLIVNDCQGVVDTLAYRNRSVEIGGQDPKLKAIRNQIKSKFISLVDKNELVVRTKWVKGHQNKHNNVQAYLNNRCDRLARNLTITEEAREKKRAKRRQRRKKKRLAT